MSLTYGKTFQIAYVVPDVDAAIDHWTGAMGVGPFFEFPLPLPFEELAVREEAVPLDADIFGAIAVSYSGDTMIELIQPGTAPSTYREFLESGQSGVHHFGTFVDDYEACMARARAQGVPVLLEGRLPLSRFAYLDTARPGLSPIIEIIEPYPAMHETFAMIREAVATWDGKDARRAL
ncbi:MULTISPECIES: VOC family protein [Novosphingobium]|uniref:Glyoxalase/Bleomycin resistance protein/Dioxygenase superfamily protein n=1 Tax=Novosphingobium mathurense TaxID=428990 RepID=A0A1U6HVI4_9SPHN|nr:MULTISPECIES: VOC family protein [Novosphingobium]CDO35187.1 conserved hypothetical protein [Novosphingobium sp. KN65.2]SLJ99822.1 Glyoxalase/Bleomycin resistance protein/Dioxygenase superfamily protein [Novosphingobium mathurense]